MRRTLFPIRSYAVTAVTGAAFALGAAACGASDGPVQLRLGACAIATMQPASVRVDVQPFADDGSALPMVSRLFEIPQGALDDGVATLAYERPEAADTANVTVTWFEQPEGLGGSVVAIYLGVDVPGRGATWELGVDACGGVASTSTDTAATDSGATASSTGSGTGTSTTATATAGTTGTTASSSTTTDDTTTGSTSDATATTAPTTGSVTTTGTTTSTTTGMTDPTGTSTTGSTTDTTATDSDTTATDSDTSSDPPMIGAACAMEGALFCDPDNRDPQRVGTLLTCMQGAWALSDACGSLMVCPSGGPGVVGCVGEGAVWACLCGTTEGCSELGTTRCDGLNLELCRPDGSVEVAQCPNDCDVSSPSEYLCE